MNAQVEVMEKSQVKLTVEIDGAQVAKAVDAAYEAMKKDFNIQGFRKGTQFFCKRSLFHEA